MPVEAYPTGQRLDPNYLIEPSADKLFTLLPDGVNLCYDSHCAERFIAMVDGDS